MPSIGIPEKGTHQHRAANEIAQAGTTVNREQPTDVHLTTADLVEPMIDMMVEQNVFDASAKVVQASDRMMGSLLDVMA